MDTVQLTQIEKTTMKVLFYAAFASLAVIASASPSGILGGGLIGTGALIGNGAVLTAPSAAAVVSGPVATLAAPAIAAPALALAAPLGVGAITNGGGAIGVSGLGATVRGPPTAPVVVAGPSGKIAASGLWGPTANIGLGALGKAW